MHEDHEEPPPSIDRPRARGLYVIVALMPLLGIGWLASSLNLSEEMASPTATAGPSIQRRLGAFNPVSNPRPWKYIVLHHSATPRGSVQSIDTEHRSRRDQSGAPWLGIGYHFVIGNGDGMADGAVESTFRWAQQLHGAHAGAADYNNHGIGICLIGDFENTRPSARQWESVCMLLRELSAEYNIEGSNIFGHGSVSATRCPGRHFPLNDLVLKLATK